MCLAVSGKSRGKAIRIKVREEGEGKVKEWKRREREIKVTRLVHSKL